MNNTFDEAMYEAAHTGIVYYARPVGGVLRLSGETVLDFLQRQTTNDINHLANQRALYTVLTSATARIIDVLSLIQTPNGIEAITLPGRAQATHTFLSSRIFFMDRVSVENTHDAMQTVVIDGVSSNYLETALGFPSEAEACSRLTLSGAEVIVICQSGFLGKGYMLLVKSSDWQIVEAAIAESVKWVEISSSVYDLVRIEAGRPGAEGELTEEYTPFEVGLGDLVNDSKGCYTGQEILARQKTYNKVAKSLVRLQVENGIKVGDHISINDRVIGSVTSAGWSPQFEHIALAIIRNNADIENNKVCIEGGVSGAIVSNFMK